MAIRLHVGLLRGAALAVPLLLCAPVWAADIQTAIKHYQDRNFVYARPLLESAVKKDPYDQPARYYLACTLLSLKQCKQAAVHFQECFQLDPLTPYGQNARQGLISLGPVLMSASREGQKSDRLAPDDPKSILQSVSSIRKQTTDQNLLSKDRGTRQATIANLNGQATERRVQSMTTQIVEDLSAANKSGNLSEEIEELKQRANFMTQRARQDAQQQATRHMHAAAERSTLIEKSATNLLALISEDPHPGHVKLKAAGTNLYVRNYGIEPAAPLVPMQAEWQLLPQAAKRLSHSDGPATLLAKPTPAAAHSKLLHPRKKQGAQSDWQENGAVYGKVLNL